MLTAEGCHTPPSYTNNKLTPALGFKVPADLRATEDIMDVSVGTDPGLTTRTRRGTLYYKVPVSAAFGAEMPSATAGRQ
jgi:hypothetical protein